MTSCHVAFAVTAWSWLTAFEPFVSRRLNAVMSNWLSSPSTPRPIWRTRSSGTPPVPGRPSPSNSGPATRRTRSASKRSLPAETGVWIVNTLSRLTVVQRGFEVDAGGDELAGALGEQERRVALVEVPDRRVDAQRPDGPRPADAEDELLVQAHLAAADVQDVADRAVGLVVLGYVRVEQEHRHAPDLDQPHGDRQRPAGQLHRHLERVAARVGDAQDRQPVEVEVGVGVLLVAVGVDRLAEVALAVHEPDPDERQGHVAGGLHVVAGEHAEPARVDAEALVEAVLGAEVGDRALQRVGVPAVEPVIRAVGHVLVEVADEPGTRP